jgi:acetyl esterase
MNLDFLPPQLLKPFAHAVVRLPRPLLRLAVGEPARVDGQELDLHCQLIARHFAIPREKLGSVEAMREDYERTGTLLGHEPDSAVELRPFTIQGSAGPVPCELYRPGQVAESNAPALIYFHGGGHVHGSLNTHRLACRQLAFESDAVVIAVEYRLAPDHKFPAGIEDSLAAYDAIAARGDELGIDPARIAVGGESAGGNIAAVIAQERRHASPPPCFQLLLVPWLDMSDYSRSYELFESGFHLSKELMDWYTAHYLNGPEDALNPLASPLLGEVDGVCPAAVLVAGFDPLRDEGRAYAEKLEAAGVPTTLRCFDSLIHPFMNFAGQVPAARAAFSEIARVLKAGLSLR